MNLSWVYSLPPFLSGLANILLAGFVLSRDPKKSSHQIFAFCSGTLSLWNFSTFVLFFDIGEPAALFLVRLIQVVVILIAPSYFHFVCEILGFKKRLFKQLVIADVMAFCLILLVALNKDFVHLQHMGYSYYGKGGPLFLVIPAYLTVFIGYSIYLVLSQMRDLGQSQKTQLKIVISAMFIALVGGLNDFLPILGITSYPGSSVRIYPYGSVIVVFYSGLIAYSILRYKFLDIEVIIRRAPVFAGLLAFVYGTFSLAMVVGQKFLRDYLDWSQWMAMVPAVFVITFALRPLENFLTDATEKFLFQKKYDYRELLRTFTNEILTVLDLQKLMEQTIAGLVKIIKLESACILLLDKEKKVYRVVASSGIRDKNIEYSETDALISNIKASREHILKDKSVDNLEGHSHLRDDFKEINACLCLPIELHSDLIGVLCLGAKKSGGDYTQEDVDILNTLARTEAIAISNARLFDELSKTQAEAAQREKMAVIGTLAAGINHEICNPLGIVRGHAEMFLLNSRDGFYKDKSREEIFVMATEIMTKVIKETDRATAITKKLSSFAKPSRRADFEGVSIEKELGEVLQFVQHDLRVNNIEVQTDFPNDFPGIFADAKQIEEVLFNIIRNAAQAIDKKEGRIVVSGFAQNGSAVIRISDDGCGIPKDKIGQVFNPFYTTKAPGKGTGLGLFIVKQVVERNNGTISLESEEGFGTTFTLKFPIAKEALVSHH